MPRQGCKENISFVYHSMSRNHFAEWIGSLGWFWESLKFANCDRNKLHACFWEGFLTRPLLVWGIVGRGHIYLAWKYWKNCSFFSRRFGSDLAGYLTLCTSIHNISGGRSNGIFGILTPRRSSLLCGFGGPARSFDPKGPPVARDYDIACTYDGWMCKRLSWYAKCIWWNGVSCIKRDPRGFDRNCGIILQPQVSLHLCRRAKCLWFGARKLSQRCHMVGLLVQWVSQKWTHVFRHSHSRRPYSPSIAGTDDWHGDILHRCVPTDRNRQLHGIIQFVHQLPGESTYSDRHEKPCRWVYVKWLRNRVHPALHLWRMCQWSQCSQWAGRSESVVFDLLIRFTVHSRVNHKWMWGHNDLGVALSHLICAFLSFPSTPWQAVVSDCQN